MKKRIFLGIETSTDNFSVAVGDGKEVFSSKNIQGKKHSEKLVPSIKEVLEEADITVRDLSAVGMGTGPGSFTGIRVGLSCGITISQILNIPVYGISSMDIAGKKINHPVIRAFRDKYYYAEYDRGKRLTQYTIITAEDKETRGCVPVEFSADLILEEVGNFYSKNIKGSWKDIKPIYVMDTVYRPKKKIKIMEN